MDRHTGKLFWSGNPDGGEMIGKITPAFSNDGTTIYVTNDSTGALANPLMAFASAVGPSVYWHNGADSEPKHLSAFSPTIAPDGRIFLHQSGQRPYAGTDSGAAITETWAADSGLNEGACDPALYQDEAVLKVIAGVLGNMIKAYDAGAARNNELWSVIIGTRIEAAGSGKRVHYDLLEVLKDNDEDPAVDRQPFAIFPFR